MIIKDPTGKYRYHLTLSERNQVRRRYKRMRHHNYRRSVARHVAKDTAYVAAALRVVEERYGA